MEQNAMRKTVAEFPFSGKQKSSYNLKEYLSAIFAHAKKADGFVCIRSGPSSFAEQSFLSVGKLENIYSELSRHDYRNCFFSFATYKGGLHPQRSEARMLNIFAFGIDIDYVNESANPEDVWEFISENTCLPTPSYIEFGHRLRLIYILAEPLRLFPKQRGALLRAFRLLQKCLCEYINEELSFDVSFGAEPTPPTSFFRMPGSINTKNGAVVQVRPISNERYTFTELFDEWILDKYTDPSGNRNEWYDEWKKKSSRNKKKPRFSATMLWTRRLRVLEEFRTSPTVHRRKTLFVYANALSWLGMDRDGVLEACLSFNQGFSQPLPTNKVLSLIRSSVGRLYKFTDENLTSYLELPAGTFSGLSKKERDRQRYIEKREAQVRHGKAKFQKMDKRRETLKGLLEKGYSLSAAAKKLKVSLSTAKRDAAVLKSLPPIQNTGQSLLPILTPRRREALDIGGCMERTVLHWKKEVPDRPRLVDLCDREAIGKLLERAITTAKRKAVAPPKADHSLFGSLIDIYIQAEKNEPPPIPVPT